MTFTPLNTTPSQILRERGSSGLFRPPGPPRIIHLADGDNPWCEFHRNGGHHTDVFWTLKYQIEKLVQEGRLRCYVRTNRSRSPERRNAQLTLPPPPPRPKSPVLETRAIQMKEPAGTISSIAGGFAGGGLTSSTRKRYVQSTHQIRAVSLCQKPVDQPDITFTKEDFDGIIPHEDDPMVVILRVGEYDVCRVLIDQGSSADVIYYYAFQRLGLKEDHLKPFGGTLVGFTNEEAQVLGYIKMEVAFGKGNSVKSIPVKFLIVKCISSYNVIMGRTSLNRLGAVVSTPCLTMKYPLGPTSVGTLKADQTVARKCYLDSLRIHKKLGPHGAKDAHRLMMTRVDPTDGFFDDLPGARLSTVEETKLITIAADGKQLKVGTALTEEGERRLVIVLMANQDVFAWSVKDIPGMSPSLTCHQLSINPEATPVAQPK